MGCPTAYTFYGFWAHMESGVLPFSLNEDPDAEYWSYEDWCLDMQDWHVPAPHTCGPDDFDCGCDLDEWYAEKKEALDVYQQGVDFTFSGYSEAAVASLFGVHITRCSYEPIELIRPEITRTQKRSIEGMRTALGLDPADHPIGWWFCGSL